MRDVLKWETKQRHSLPCHDPQTGDYKYNHLSDILRCSYLQLFIKNNELNSVLAIAR